VPSVPLLARVGFLSRAASSLTPLRCCWVFPPKHHRHHNHQGVDEKEQKATKQHCRPESPFPEERKPTRPKPNTVNNNQQVMVCHPTSDRVIGPGAWVPRACHRFPCLPGWVPRSCRQFPYPSEPRVGGYSMTPSDAPLRPQSPGD
jgi:hypothetical protein